MNVIAKIEKVNYFPTSLWKYGVNKNFELRLITELTTVDNNTSKITGLNPITIGFKTKILEEKGIVPLTSFIGHFKTANIGSKALKTNFSSPSFRFLMQHTLSEKAVLAYNLGAEWKSDSPEATYIYTLTTGINLTQKLGCYFELFGSLPETSKPIHQFDGGFTYLINDDFILDLFGGNGLTKNAPKNYYSIGISFRFNTSKNVIFK